MVTSEQLCAAVESLLAIDYSKTYKTWRDINVIQLAKSIAANYRAESQTITPTDVQQLRPAESRTFVDGQLDLEFSAVPESLRELAFCKPLQPSEEDHPLALPDVEAESASLRQLAAYEASYERHPAPLY